MDFTDVKGVPNVGARVWFLLKELQKEPSCIFLLTGSEELELYSNAFTALAPFAGNLPEFEVVLWSQLPEVKARALKTVYGGSLARKKTIFISSLEAFGENLPASAAYKALGFSFKTGWSYARQEMQNRFLKAGYRRVSFVEERGQCAFRGSVVDFFAPDLEKPVRLFFTDALESIRFFEIDTQHTSGFLESVAVAPARASDASVAPASLMNGGWKFFADSCVPEETLAGMRQAGAGGGSQKPAFPAQSSHTCFKAYRFTAISGGAQALDFGAVKNLNFNSDTAILAGELARLKARGCAPVLFCLNRGES